MPSQIRTLLDKLILANETYRQGVPVMDDATYDAGLDTLILLISAGPVGPDVQEAQKFIASVGAAPAASSGWAKVVHTVPMGSLDKATNPAEYAKWHNDLDLPVADSYVVSDKLDGFSIDLRIEGGRLSRAVTRGDGVTGEDITPNVRKMKGILPSYGNFTGNFRGEVTLDTADWEKYFPEKANPRNAAVGIGTASKTEGAGCEHLTVRLYRVIKEGGQPVPSQEIAFKLLEHLGCLTPAWSVVSALQEVEAIRDRYIAGVRAIRPYLMDGLVVQVNNMATFNDLGDKNDCPVGAVAYKFPAEKKPTTLRNIRWQVGKSGRVTPVAEFDPVQLAGATISNASLHNISLLRDIANQGGQATLRVGDTILVSRRGDVIPQVETLITSNGGNPLEVPSVCPECGSLLLMEGEYLVCRGEECPAQVLGGIVRWCKKLNLLGWGDSVVSALIDAGKLSDVADLYALDPTDIESVISGGSRLGRTAHVIVGELRSKGMEIPLHIAVGSLGIPLCARSVCKTLVDAGYDTLDKMRLATSADLVVGVPGMGLGKAQSFVTGLKAREALIDRMIANGVKILAKATGHMTGKSVCFTGVRSPEMEQAIEAAGGTLKSGVGKGLTYLVAADPNSTSGKAKKAQQFGVQVVGLDDMWTILGGKPGNATQKPSGPPPGVTPRKAAPAPASDDFVLPAPTPKPQPASPVFDILSMFGDED